MRLSYESKYGFTGLDHGKLADDEKNIKGTRGTHHDREHKLHRPWTIDVLARWVLGFCIERANVG